jgi:transcriptional regulator with XRE-family HTH domain
MNGLNFDPGYTPMYSRRMKSTSTISARLDQAMQDAKIKSQSELQRRSGVPQATISRILKGGGAKGPETDTLKKLADACNVSFDWLLSGRASTSHQRPILVAAPAENEQASPDEILQLIRDFADSTPKDRQLALKTVASAAARNRRANIRQTAGNKDQ